MKQRSWFISRWGGGGAWSSHSCPPCPWPPWCFPGCHCLSTMCNSYWSNHFLVWNISVSDLWTSTLQTVPQAALLCCSPQKFQQKSIRLGLAGAILSCHVFIALLNKNEARQDPLHHTVNHKRSTFHIHLHFTLVPETGTKGWSFCGLICALVAFLTICQDRFIMVSAAM